MAICLYTLILGNDKQIAECKLSRKTLLDGITIIKVVTKLWFGARWKIPYKSIHMALQQSIPRILLCYFVFSSSFYASSYVSGLNFGFFRIFCHIMRLNKQVRLYVRYDRSIVFAFIGGSTNSWRWVKTVIRSSRTID